MKMYIPINLTPVQYMKLDEKARRMRRPMDKAMGQMVDGHLDYILDNTHWGQVK